jgi:hypothetical protein
MDIKKKLAGSFDLLMLFGRGIEAFSGKKRDALLSLVIPAALFPFSLVFSACYPPKGMEHGYPLSQILMTVSLGGVISMVVSLALIAGLAWGFKKLDRFWLYLDASNWTGLAIFIAMLPFILAAVMGWIQREEMDRIFVIIQCYLYVVTGCIFFRAFQVNWQLAGFMMIVILFVNQMTLEFLFRVQGIEYPW